jgi:alkylated DNA nucleotide flippase Atl1
VLEEKPELKKLAEAVYRVAAELSRGEILTYAAITQACGVAAA